MNPLLSGLAFALPFFVGSFLALLVLSRPGSPGSGKAGMVALIIVGGLSSLGHLVLGRPIETATFALGLGAACLVPVGPLRGWAIPGRMSFVSLAAALTTFLVYIGGAILGSSLGFGGFLLSLLLFAMELSAAPSAFTTRMRCCR